MREIIRWVSEARAEKDIGPAMTHYRVVKGSIRATNGKLTASYPWENEDDDFLVSGLEFEKVLARMDSDDVAITCDLLSENITVTSSKFNATIATLPLTSWDYPGVDDAQWMDIPDDFLAVLRSLRAFVPDNPAQLWIGCVALDHGNCYATNNIAVAGCACDVGDVKALLPAVAVDFVLRREEDLESWAWTDNYVAFKWSNGAWLRSQLVIGEFHKSAAALVRSAYALEPTQEITEDFRAAFTDVAGLAEDTVSIYSDRIESRFKRSVVVADVECETPKDGVSVWGAQFLVPVISQATHWSPSLWPERTPFRGDNVAGFIVGRKKE